MSRLLVLVVATMVSTPVLAHHPDRKCQPVHPRYDVIGPLGNRLPESYRRSYNRPTYLGGKIAYKIAPSSQEAMAWHRAEHRCAYDKCEGRRVPQYFYPKPWEALKVGARTSKDFVEDDEAKITPATIDPAQRFDDAAATNRSLEWEELEVSDLDSGSQQMLESVSPPPADFKDLLESVDLLELDQ
ncbi:hypothetical protein CA13_54850 [Planctomycetes bacterium CA13]|uniref:Uncharacterized protein n=1 Tax=Novipirellula herctigrandis TaxID=2527986 RepID=A0A5C5ZAY2_9BACT|nr:hypothetical protein CA13_54850 [Planctomycetes bacterium CA13]